MAAMNAAALRTRLDHYERLTEDRAPRAAPDRRAAKASQ
jgi:hypothetical protein